MSAPPSPMDLSSNGAGGGTSPAHTEAGSLMTGSNGAPGMKRQRSMDSAAIYNHIQSLRGEVTNLKELLKQAEESRKFLFLE